MTRKKFYDIVTRDSDAAAQDALDPEGEVGEDLESFLEKFISSSSKVWQNKLERLSMANVFGDGVRVCQILTGQKTCHEQTLKLFLPRGK
jgi:hypothetical protein